MKLSVPEIIVCMKVVPRPEEVRINPETLTLDRSNVRSVINPADMNALEAAFALKDRYGGRVRLLSMGPPLFEPYMRLAIALGADDATLLSDRAFGGADTLATSYTLATAIQKMGRFDLVICGEESSDGATAQVPPGIAEWLGAAQVTFATELALVDSRWRLRASRELQGGHETIVVPLPAVVSVVSNSNEPRFIEMDRRAYAEEAPFTVWNAEDLEADPTMIGLPGSPTAVAGTHEAERRERRRERLTGTPEELARALVERIGPEIAAAIAARGAEESATAEVEAARAAERPASRAWTRLRRSERAPAMSAGDLPNGHSWSGRATLLEQDQTVQAELLVDLWKEEREGHVHWGGMLRTELGGGHLPLTGEYALRLETGEEGRVAERGQVRTYSERGLSGEQVEVRGLGEPPF